MELLFEHENEVASVMGQMINLSDHKRSFTFLEDMIDTVRLGKISVKLINDSFFLEMGHYAHYMMVCVNSSNIDYVGFCRLIIEKHKRYGAEPITRWGGLGVVIRIDSKFARLKNLSTIENLQSGDETVLDTAQDILGYCILGYQATKVSK